MAKTAMKQTFELELKDKWTKANCEVTLAVDGKTVPNAEVMGRALEEASALIRERIAQSYVEVPPRPVQPVTATGAVPGSAPGTLPLVKQASAAPETATPAVPAVKQETRVWR